MGGLDPLYVAFSQACIPPPKEGQLYRRIPLVAFGGKPTKGNPSGVFPRVILPRDGPPLGIARIRWGVLLVAIVPIFTDLFGLSWEIILSQ